MASNLRAKASNLEVRILEMRETLGLPMEKSIHDLLFFFTIGRGAPKALVVSPKSTSAECSSFQPFIEITEIHSLSSLSFPGCLDALQED